jgi:GT2 family glycosyltransferase
MKLSVIIVNYNVRQFLENALISISRAMQGLDGEIFVVDNASDDGSAELVRNKFPGVRLLENKENVGFAKANNMALREAKGELLLLINPDTIVQEDTLRVMIRFFEETPDAGLAGCKVLNPDGTFQAPCRRSFPTPWVAFTKIFGLSTLFPKSRVFGRYNLTYLSEDETYSVDAVSGSFMMVRREAFQKVGGLDEDFFMYGEDLDWCYRILAAGYSVYYVHKTKIIHFRGESTRRSNIDELRHFYRAMQLFVRKHFNRSRGTVLILNAGIVTRATVAWFGRLGRPLLWALPDIAGVVLSLLVAERIHMGALFHYPSYAYPAVWLVPAALVTAISLALGLYTRVRWSVLRSIGAVAAGYVLVSSIVFFVKEYAFSRAVVLIAGVLSVFLLPGWRLAIRAWRNRSGGKSLFGRRTLIVGTGTSAQEVFRRLRSKIDSGYDVLGFVDMTRRRVGEKVGGLPILGSIDNVGKVIDEQRVGEVIFSTDGITYEDILSVIARSRNRDVNFRLVPDSLEAIIGKTHIDTLDTMPLVEIDYNIHRPFNRFVKRLFDIVVSGILLVTVYPASLIRNAPGRWTGFLPDVLKGRVSMVGLPLNEAQKNGYPLHESMKLGPAGLTGLLQLHHGENLDEEEKERYRLYYAKNQSLWLDCEILMKSAFARKKS